MNELKNTATAVGNYNNISTTLVSNIATVNIVDGKVYINDSEEPLDDSFCPETPEGSFGPYTVPEGCYFMLGDNRNHSMDSRYWQKHRITASQFGNFIKDC